MERAASAQCFKVPIQNFSSLVKDFNLKESFFVLTFEFCNFVSNFDM